MSYSVEIEQTKANINTVKINGIYIHSKYNPVREAEQYIQRIYKDNVFYVIVGNGLGYYTEEMLKKLSSNQFIVIEPIKELAQGENVFTFDDEQDLERVLKRKIPANKDVTVITIPNYEKFFSELQLKIHSIVKDKVLIDQIFNNTVQNQTPLWQENFIRNLAFIKDDHNIYDLKGKFNDPIVIASGGPSLDNQIPLLKQYRDKYILIAAGSTITSLMKHDLEPDYVIVMDGKLNNFHLFKDLQFSKAQLIYSMVAHYKIREQHSQKCYSYFSSECLGLEDTFKLYAGIDPLYLHGGGSVSSYALSFARFISSGPITFVGQDLSYTKGKSHAQSSKKFHEISEEFKKLHGVFETLGYNGELVQTSPQFLAMKHALETVVEDLENSHHLYNSTEAGLNIIGVPNLKLQEFFDKYLTKQVLISENLSSQNQKTNVEKIKILIQQDLDNLKQALLVLNDSKSLLYVSKSKMNFSNSVNKSLDNNDLKLNKLLKNSLISISVKKIMLSLNKAEQGNSTVPSFNQVYNSNMLLIDELTSLLETSIKIMKETLNYIDTESWNEHG